MSNTKLEWIILTAVLLLLSTSIRASTTNTMLVPYSSNLNSPNVSVVVWINATTLPFPAWSGIVDHSDYGGYRGYQIVGSYTTSNVRLQVGNNSAESTGIDIPLVQGQLVQIALTYNGSYLKGYKNGVYQSSSALHGISYYTPPSQFSNLSIGNRFGIQQFNGTIINVQIYNTTLSTANIQSLYSEGAGGAPLSQHLVGVWFKNASAATSTTTSTSSSTSTTSSSTTLTSTSTTVTSVTTTSSISTTATSSTSSATTTIPGKLLAPMYNLFFLRYMSPTGAADCAWIGARGKIVWAGTQVDTQCFHNANPSIIVAAYTDRGTYANTEIWNSLHNIESAWLHWPNGSRAYFTFNNQPIYLPNPNSSYVRNWESTNQTGCSNACISIPQLKSFGSDAVFLDDGFYPCSINSVLRACTPNGVPIAEFGTYLGWVSAWSNWSIWLKQNMNKPFHVYPNAVDWFTYPNASSPILSAWLRGTDGDFLEYYPRPWTWDDEVAWYSSMQIYYYKTNPSAIIDFFSYSNELPSLSWEAAYYLITKNFTTNNLYVTPPFNYPVPQGFCCGGWSPAVWDNLNMGNPIAPASITDPFNDGTIHYYVRHFQHGVVVAAQHRAATDNRTWTVNLNGNYTNVTTGVRVNSILMSADSSFIGVNNTTSSPPPTITATSTATTSTITPTPTTSTTSVTSSYTVSAQSTTPTTTQPAGGSGGGSGAGGGGVHRPNIIRTSYGYLVTSIAQLNTFNVTLCGAKLNVTENYITPSYGGFTVNGASYTLTQNSTVYLFGSDGCYMRLFNVTYIPLQQTISVGFYSTTNTIMPNKTSTPNQRINISIYSQSRFSVTPSNLSSFVLIKNTTSVSQPPQYFSSLLALNISVRNVSVNMINLNLKYACGISPSALQPFLLKNSTWLPITRFVVNQSSCFVSFTLPRDPIIALMQYSPPTTSTTSTIPPSPTPQPNMPQTTSLVESVLASLFPMAIIVLVVVYFLKRKRADIPPQEPPKIPPTQDLNS